MDDVDRVFGLEVHHTVATVEAAHVGTELLDDANGLVAQDCAGVEVLAADCRRGEADDGVRKLLDLGSGTSSNRMSPTQCQTIALWL